jgi:hypothetical protein
MTEVFSTRELRGITGDKIEGLALIAADELALVNDNDFGLGDRSAERSMLWTVRIPSLPALLR